MVAGRRSIAFSMLVPLRIFWESLSTLEPARSRLRMGICGLAAIFLSEFWPLWQRPEFEFSDIEDKDDRKAFIEKFSAYSLKGESGAGSTSEHTHTAKGSSEPTASPNDTKAAAEEKPRAESDTAHSERLSGDPGTTETSTPAAASRRDSTDTNRKTLAPVDGPRVLPVEGIRLLPLYNECRKIKVKGNENAAAFLVRVFVELSSEHYLQEKSVQLPRSLKDKNVSSWDDYKVRLADKITAVCLHLDPTDKAPAFLPARQAIAKNSVGPFSINMLHSYFHNRHVLPEEATIKASWDGWETYLRAVYVALKST